MNSNTQALPERKKPEILEVKPLIETANFNIEQVTLKFSNGEVRNYQRFEQWPHGIIMVIPMIDDETLLIIREYCAGIEEYTLTLPKGRVEPDESPSDAANREMQEEIGYKASEMIPLQVVTQSPSYSATQMHIFLAKGLSESRLEGDEPEPIDVIPWKIKDIDRLIERKDFHEGRAIAGLYLAQRHLGLL